MIISHQNEEEENELKKLLSPHHSLQFQSQTQNIRDFMLNILYQILKQPHHINFVMKYL
jgi:hypothetical protein